MSWYSNFKEQEIYEGVNSKLTTLMEAGLINEEDADEFILDEEISEMSAQELDDFLSDFLFESAESYVLESLTHAVNSRQISLEEAVDLSEDQEFMANAIMDAIEEGTLSPPEAGEDEESSHSGEYDEIKKDSIAHMDDDNDEEMPSKREYPAAGHGKGAGGTIGPKALVDKVKTKDPELMRKRAYETKADPSPQDIKEDAITKVLRRVYGNQRYPY